MLRRFSVNFALFSILLDSILVGLSMAIATYIRPSLSDLPFAANIERPSEIPQPLYLLFPVAWVAIMLLLSVYDGRRNFQLANELTNITIASILAGVSLAGSLYLSFREISRLQFLTFMVLAYTSLVFWRLIVRLLYRLGNRTQSNQRRVLIVGAGPVGKALEEKVCQHSYSGLSVVGFLDDDSLKRAKSRDILGALSDARRVINKHMIGEVVIALPQRAHKNVNQLVAELHTLPVKVWLIPDYFHLALHKAVVEEFAGLPMLDLRAPALNDYQRMVKRAFDLTITILVLPFSLILMALIALAIRLEGPGVIFFKQERVGENGKVFGMLKFRTMVPEAEKLRNLVERYDLQGRLIHKTSEDPRITRAGRFLRRTSLDELPQLINILKGEMSLVGPRPELPYLVDRYEPWQRKRFAVPQGITGWWQVNGRSDRPMHLHTEDDLYYVQHYSLLLDLHILLKTIFVVIRGKGAF